MLVRTSTTIYAGNKDEVDIDRNGLIERKKCLNNNNNLHDNNGKDNKDDVTIDKNELITTTICGNNDRAYAIKNFYNDINDDNKDEVNIDINGLIRRTIWW